MKCSRISRWLVVGSAGLLAGVLACGSGEPTDGAGAGGDIAADGGPSDASHAVDFTLPDLDGADVNLADHRGKVAIVDFWATWCPPCLFQVPELNKLDAAHAEAGDLAVIGVSVDVEGVEVVRPWVAENQVGYSIVLGDERLAREFGAVGFPTLAVVRPNGTIHSLHVGLVEYDELEELVAAAQAP